MRAVCGLLALSACTASPVFVGREGASSALLAFRDEVGAWQIQAHALDGVDALEAPSPDGQATLLLYDRALVDLGLSAGVLELAELGDALPKPHRIVAIDAGEARELGDLPLEVGGLHLVHRQRCLEIAYASQGTFSSGAILRFAIAAGARGLVSSSDGFFWMGADGPIPALELGPELPSDGAFWDVRAGELWLLSKDGRVMHGDPARGLVAAPSFPTPGSLTIQVDGPEDPLQAFELFVRTSSLAIYRFDGAAWSEIAPPSAINSEIGLRLIAWTGPGSAIALTNAPDEIIEVQSGRARRRSIPGLDTGTGLQELSSVRHYSGRGSLLGTNRGRLLENNGAGWVSIGTPPAAASAFVIERVGDVVLYGGEDGTINQQLEGLNCELSTLRAAADAVIVALIPADDRWATLHSHGVLGTIPYLMATIR